MADYRLFIVYACYALILAAGLLVPTNPDHTFPILPEGIAILAAGLALWVATREDRTKPNSYSKTEVILLSMIIGNFFLLMLPRMLISMSGNPCHLTGSMLYRLECLFFYTSSWFNGFRLFTYLSTAHILFVTSFLLVRKNPRYFKLCCFVLPLTALLFLAGAEIVAKLFHLKSLAPVWITSASIARTPMSSWFSNQGWVWPYLSLALVGSCYLAFKQDTQKLGKKILYVSLFVLSCVVMLWTRQRGAWILTFIVMSVSVFRFLSKRGDRKAYVGAAFGAGGILSLLAIFVIYFKDLEPWIRTHLGFVWRKNPVSMSTERLQLWRDALRIFNKDWVFGKGYGSWKGVSSEAYGRGRIYGVFDTAHNWLVQSLLELGSLHTLLLLAVIFVIIRTAFKNAPESKDRKFLVVLSVVALIFVTSFQEIDYVRPTFYLYAVFWGALLAGGSDRVVQSSVRFTNTTSVMSCVAMAIGSIALCLYVGLFSWGTYAFENGGERGLERWTKASPSLLVTKGFGSQYYTIFPARILGGRASEFRYEVSASSRTEYFATAVRKKTTAIPLPNPSWGVKRYDIDFGSGLAFQSRSFGARLRYPPIQSTLAMTSVENGVLNFDDSGKYSLSCEGACSFVVQSCHSTTSLNFALAAPDASSSQSVKLVIRPIDAENFESNQSQILVQRDAVIPVGETPLQVFENLSSPSGWFHVTIDSQAKQGISIFESSCQSNLLQK